MSRSSVFPALFALLVACADEASREEVATDPARGDDPRIAEATSAAPEAVARQATVIAFDDSGSERTLREGAGPFTCFPDDPATPGMDPMCFDAAGLEWARAWMGRESPPAGPIGVAYMLRGSWTASNTDPYATEPAAGEEWVETGPALMILHVQGRTGEYPHTPGDDGHPFVMWAGTPYEHLMVPLDNDH